jgi:L-fucose mutarotase
MRVICCRDTYKKIVNDAEGRDVPVEEVERFQFYDVAKKAFAVISTGETAFYANIILKKGIIGDSGSDKPAGGAGKIA